MNDAPIDWTLCPRRAPALEIDEAADGFLVYQADRDRLHHLNATAVLLLDACDGSRRAADLPALLAEAFGLSEPPVADVAACLESLLGEGLLVPGDAPDASAPDRGADRP